jgi:hypothetical protein
MSFSDARSVLLALKVDARLRHADGGLWHVRGLLPNDEIAVARTWSVQKQRWHYDTIRPEALMVGLFRAEIP